MPVGIETILVQRYEVLNVKTQESESFSSWDAAERYYDKQCEAKPRDEIKLVAVVCESWK